ncbi:sce7726 family protein [Oryzobacter sp. R7]|uniref:sce7726 family protein n=1 Tax=Oryzobacter faecalis TaxID=3388656 RepID=UPI00398D340F
MRDGEIRHVLIEGLRAEHAGQSDVRVWPEMSVCLGASRVDVGLVNGALSGYEIKSDRDNLGRLPSQIEHYSQCLDFASLVVGQRHLSTARSLVPRWWGIVLARPTEGDSVALVTKRKARRNPALSPFHVAQLMWREEAMAVLRNRGLHHGLSKATRWDLWDLLATLPIDELRSEVRSALTARPLLPTA